MWMEAAEIPRAVQPGVVQVDQRANGQYPEFYRRQRRTNRNNPSAAAPMAPTPQRSIITMRHVRQHLPVVEGELMDEEVSLEEQQLQVDAVVSQPKLHRDNTESTEGLSDHSSSFNLSSECLNTSNNLNSNHHHHPMLQARDYLKSRFGKILKKNKTNNHRRRTKEVTEEEIRFNNTSSDLVLSAPMQRGVLQSEDVTNVTRMADPLRSTGRRNLRLSESSIPEGVSFEPNHAGSIDVVQEEVELEDQLVQQIQTIFPEADRGETHRLIREGQSVRDMVGLLCVSRSISQVSDSANTEGAVQSDEDLLAAIEENVKILQDAFPNVNVDRSYALLREKSLQTIMTQLAEESLNDSANFQNFQHFQTTPSDYPSTSELANIRMIQDAFPRVEKDEARVMLRMASLSSVMMQLALETASSSSTQDNNDVNPAMFPVETNSTTSSSSPPGRNNNSAAADQLCEVFPELSSADAQKLLSERTMSRAMEHLLVSSNHETTTTPSSPAPAPSNDFHISPRSRHER